MATLRQQPHEHRPDTPRNGGDSDAPHVSPVTPDEDVRTNLINRVSWGAILAGVAIALVAQLLLSMVGVGIGVSTLDPGTADNPSATNFSVTAAIWWGVSGIVAAFLGGFAAGRLAGVPKESTASWHGLTSWAVTTLVIFYLVTTTASSLLGGTLSTLTSVVGGAASGAGSVAQAVAPAVTGSSDPFTAIEQAITGSGQNVAQNGQTDLRDAAVASVRAVLTGNPSDATQAREEAAQALSRAQGIPLEQARAQIDQYEQQYRATAQNITQQATEVADTAATAISTAALVGAFALLLGAIAGWLGGRTGAVNPTITAAGLYERRVR
jgi:ElaB/YqjD/DUF883 family membrane-anchored ribosome-binding protein